MTTIIDQFWGDYRWLSNFYPCQVKAGIWIAPSTEHAYQSLKCADAREALEIVNCASPGKAKRMGSKCVIRKDWEEVKMEIMYDLNWQKFSQNEDLKAKLLATGDTPIFEGNTWGDKFWGIDIDTGEGENHLGKIIMKIRHKLFIEMALES